MGYVQSRGSQFLCIPADEKKQPKGDFFWLSNDPPSIHTPVSAHGVNSMWGFSRVLSGRVLHSCGTIKLCKKTSSKWSTYFILLLLPSKWQTICLETQDPGEQTKAILCPQEAEQPYLKHCKKKKSLLQTVLQRGKTNSCHLLAVLTWTFGRPIRLPINLIDLDYKSL